MKLTVIDGGRRASRADERSDAPALRVVDGGRVEVDEASADAADRMARLKPHIRDGALIRKVATAARKEVRRLRFHGIPVSSSTHVDLAHDALLLTINGARP